MSLLIRMLFLCERLELNVVFMGMNILAGWLISIYFGVER